MKLNKRKISIGLFAKREWRGNKQDCQGHGDIPKANPASLETVFRCRKRASYWLARGAYDANESKLVVLAYARYRLGARMLEVVIRKIYKTSISHNNRICMYLKTSGQAHDDPNKKNRRKWIRYERGHGLSACRIEGMSGTEHMSDRHAFLHSKSLDRMEA